MDGLAWGVAVPTGDRRAAEAPGVPHLAAAARYLRVNTGSGASPEAASLAAEALPIAFAALDGAGAHPLAAWSDARLAEHPAERVEDAVRAACYVALEASWRANADIADSAETMARIASAAMNGRCERGPSCPHRSAEAAAA